uniref:Glutamine amidotransferase type-2 domain-containing protein n=1 Tax=Mucochytrium quahogii TaxID=96639 RepID=A0A7S2SRY2_9STRA|mmetsp:Transcript_7794/g.14391  ORF Transcript_7794/g.14391 Transcript_7794/m.14391 type:complete len:632 (-) Transcript_7794:991-2886(-)|eukprot:CAMPEP_0203744972 /NCGR_PEP_ID=MMETSP0098-20131031/863_1 /ASSEMBLY_ACC=CAM_ASM_000208 /TAXON_ID=96639 /ORGANISM=" , Strain NY0313808BC1" /LENGTH=631 /DNA_ID=CAMNT_0050632627 /DNA_START=427 /DNA_END=2322 /DNA_ORIENTATION=+
MCGICMVVVHDALDKEDAVCNLSHVLGASKSIENRGPDSFREKCVPVGRNRVIASCAVLDLRGQGGPVEQPVEDSDKNMLLFNGEIYRGPEWFADRAEGASDTMYLLEYLHKYKTADEIVNALSLLQGPWSLIYWQQSTGKLYFGRDPLGRRSLLIKNTKEMLVLASVAPHGETGIDQWSEVVPSGIYYTDINEVDVNVIKLVDWPVSNPVRAVDNDTLKTVEDSAEKLLQVLDEAVRIRVQCNNGSAVGILFSGGLDCTVLAALAHRHVPSSDPIDLLNVCFKRDHSSPDRQTAIASWNELRKSYPERKWNLVCINRSGDHVDDSDKHIFSLILPKVTHMDFNIGAALWFAASGRGNLLISTEADDDQEKDETFLSMLLGHGAETVVDQPGSTKPAQTTMGCHLTQGCKRVPKAKCRNKACAVCCKKQQLEPDGIPCNTHKLKRGKKRKPECDPVVDPQQPSSKVIYGEEYCSPARILLSGIGADEQLAGYGRHRVSFKKGGWEALEQELKLDMGRIWERNMGRDDRCICDHGREVRQPYLDEHVTAMLLRIPLAHIFSPNLPRGAGDKRLLRLICYKLNLPRTSGFEKRAIQFGTRIAQMSNVKSFGSNSAFRGDTVYQLHSNRENPSS